MRLLAFLAALAALAGALPAAAQITPSNTYRFNLPVVCDTGTPATRCTVSTPVTDADGSPVMGPTASAANALTPVTGSLVTSLQGKATAGNLYGFTVVAGATPLWAYVFNGTTDPADGAVVAGPAVGQYQDCAPVAASARFTANYDFPERYNFGARLVVSSTACGTLTKSATATFLKVRSQ